MLLVGTVDSIWRYPIKSLGAVSLSAAEIAEDGIPGDRARALIVRDGHARVGKTYRGKENNLLHTTHAAEEARALAQSRHVSVEVESQQSHYFDCAPISLIVDRWLDELSSLVGYELEPLRFRPNLFATAAAEFHENEPALAGARLRIGSVVLRVRKPIERCVTPTYDLRSGTSDPSVLRAVTDHRAASLGIYCDVESAGRVAVGDAISRQ